MRKLRKSPKVIALALAAVVVTVVAAAGSPASAAKSTEPVTLRLGYFPNVTHAAAIVGVEGGIFAKKLGSGVDLQLKTFNSGTEAIAAIQADALDATYIGPSPTITAWTQFDKGVKVFSGSASGGAYFVVKPNITSAADLKGKAVATPAARQHAGRRAALVAQEAGTQHGHHRRRRRVDQAPGQRDVARRVQAR